MMTLSWVQIVRLGLVQMCLGAIVVLTTSTLNRLMVIEQALPAVLPGMLVALHYGVQVTRPRWGFASDCGGHRTRFIIGGMAILGTGTLLATLGVLLFGISWWGGLALSVLAYVLIGIGVGASGTSLLAMLASSTAPHRRAAAATITWLMMIAGIAVTAGTVGALLSPYSPGLLLRIVTAVVMIALLLTTGAIHGIEARVKAETPPVSGTFREGLLDIWTDPKGRRFTIFVFLSMTAYFMQELILEPYAGLIFGLSPGQTTQLSGAQNGGVFMGMLAVGILSTGFKMGELRSWTVAGCVGSGSALVGLGLLGMTGQSSPLVPLVVSLGFFNGMFAVAAIGSMMSLAGQGREGREGTRMGLWGAAQAIAAGFGGLVGAAAVDALRSTMRDDQAFASVFSMEAGLFLIAAMMALNVIERRREPILAPGE